MDEIDPHVWFSDDCSVSLFTKVSNPWGRISEIAAKLGVAPHENGNHTTVATGNDGKLYDIWDVLSAALDKLNERI